MGLKLVVGYHLAVESEARRFRKVFNRYLDDIGNIDLSELYTINSLRLIDLSDFSIDDISVIDCVNAGYSFKPYKCSGFSRDSLVILGIKTFIVDGDFIKVRLVYGDGDIVPVYFNNELVNLYSRHLGDSKYSVLHIKNYGNTLSCGKELSIFIDVISRNMCIRLDNNMIYGVDVIDESYKYSYRTGFSISLDELPDCCLPYDFTNVLHKNCIVYMGRIAGVYLDGSLGDYEIILPNGVNKLVLFGREYDEDSDSNITIVIPPTINNVTSYSLEDSLHTDGGINLKLCISKQASKDMIVSLYRCLNIAGFGGSDYYETLSKDDALKSLGYWNKEKFKLLEY